MAGVGCLPVAGSQVEAPQQLGKSWVGGVQLLGALAFGDGQVPKLGAWVQLGPARVDEAEGAVGAGAVGQPGGDGGGEAGGFAQDARAGLATGRGLLESEEVVEGEVGAGEGGAGDGVASSEAAFGGLGGGDQVGDVGSQGGGLLREGSVETGVVQHLRGPEGRHYHVDGAVGRRGGGPVMGAPVAKVLEAGGGLGLIAGCEPGEPGGVVVGVLIAARLPAGLDELASRLVVVGVGLEAGLERGDPGGRGCRAGAIGRDGERQQEEEGEAFQEEGKAFHGAASVKLTAWDRRNCFSTLAAMARFRSSRLLPVVGARSERMA